MIKKSLFRIVVLLICMVGFQESNAVVNITPKAEVKSVLDLNVNDLSTLKKKALETKIGRKLTIKEKIALRVVKRKIKKDPNYANLGPDDELDEPKKTDGMAIAGFVCGLVSIFFAGIILGILGVVFSAISFGNIEKSKYKKGKGLAIAGLVLGLIGAIGAAIFIASM